MAQVYLISPEFIKGMTNVSDNLSDKYLQSAIRESQDVDLQSVLGTKLYKKIKALVADGTIDNAGNEIYKEIADNAQYMLAYNAIAKVVVITSVKIDNMGNTQTSDERVTNISVNDTFKIQKVYQDKADFYTKRLQAFLAENHKDIPEICKNSCYDIHSNLSSTESSGIWLGGKRGKGITKYHKHC